MRGAPGAPEQHGARLTSLQQTVARVRGTLAAMLAVIGEICSSGLQLLPLLRAGNPAAFYFLMPPELSAAPQAPTSDLPLLQ